MRALTLLSGLVLAMTSYGQSIHQEQLEHYNSLGIDEDAYTAINRAESNLVNTKFNRSNCSMERVVFGWHPYWSNGKEDQYQWDLMTDLSFFSYEVDANTGNANSTHGWATNDAVDSALANGVRVNLCVTLFSGHTTFFSDPNNSQTLITNLINLVQSRGAHGVNIDFEGIPSSQTANFTNFMIDLCNQMHTAIPGSQVSTVLYAVDWNNVFDIAALDPHVDLFTIMGYGYYYNGSGNAGPTDPLYHFGNSYNYTLSKTVTYYLDQGVTPSKLILGLPYYGYEWNTSSANMPSSTTASGSAKTYQQIRNNTSGNYSTANETWVYETISTNYTYNDGNWNQAFIDSKYDMAERLEFINHRDIGGMAIWALGYDYNYTDYWDVIRDNFTTCAMHPCVDTLYDMGGPVKDYYDDEAYTYTITADNAANLELVFDTIDIEVGYDYLYVYDGSDVTAPQIPGSPFSGQYAGFSWTSTGNAITFRFTSDGATNNSGWKAIYYCNQDSDPPTTAINPTNNWETQDFSVSFNDQDNGMGVHTPFYLVADTDGNGSWYANDDNGFKLDVFDQLTSDWTLQTTQWNASGGLLEHLDENESNSNLWSDLTQDNAHAYLYEWDAMMTGNLTNRRSGMHLFCDDPTLSNRGNSYFVYYRVDSDKCQIYSVDNNVFTLETDDPVDLDPGLWYNYKVHYDPITGEIKAYVDDVLVSSWTDATPLQSGNSVSFRTGGCQAAIDNLKIYKSRTANETVTIGSAASDVRYQNMNPSSPSCEIYSICVDSANLWSSTASQLVNIDWTEAGPLSVVDEFVVDADTFYTSTEISGSWGAYQDTNSLTTEYWYCVGDAPGDSNIVAWTNNGLTTLFTETGLSLINGTTYYVSVRSVNGAGIVSNNYTSDGNLLLSTTSLEEIEDFAFTIYPNPASNHVVLKTDGHALRYVLLDMTGRQVMQGNLNTGETTLDISQLASGKYQLQVWSGSVFKVEQLIKTTGAH